MRAGVFDNLGGFSSGPRKVVLAFLARFLVLCQQGRLGTAVRLDPIGRRWLGTGSSVLEGRNLVLKILDPLGVQAQGLGLLLDNGAQLQDEGNQFFLRL